MKLDSRLIRSSAVLTVSTTHCLPRRASIQSVFWGAFLVAGTSRTKHACAKSCLIFWTTPWSSLLEASLRCISEVVEGSETYLGIRVRDTGIGISKEAQSVFSSLLNKQVVDNKAFLAVQALAWHCKENRQSLWMAVLQSPVRKG